MSNRSSSSSTRSQLTSASDISKSDRNADSSSRTENHPNKNNNLRVNSCDYSWNIDISDSKWTRRKLQSSIFPSAGDDLKWRLEFTKQTYEGEFISITLHLENENVFFKKYNAVKGVVTLSIKRSDGSNVQKKNHKFVILNTDDTCKPVLPRIGFSDPREYPYLGQPSIGSQSFIIICKITYVTSKKKLRENPTSSLSNDLENLLTNKQFGDAIIKVKDKEYPVYKGILAARSPVFERMFREDNGMLENTTNVVNISDLSPEIIEEMLLFIYTGKVKKLEKSVYELLPAANKYQLEELMEICEEMLIEQLSKDNVINILILAHTHNANWLKTEALQFVKSYSRSEDLKQSEIWEVLTSYRDLTKDVLAVLLDK
ncbi:protein roadkill-like [Planococcus citri]|uniref:protein roadkill-like n=1 Tax=Planococcus citri TaxID=170843 RepID=UPI0031F8FCD5